MNFDFSALLVLLTFVSGVIWAIDAWIFAPRRLKQKNSEDDAVEREIRSDREPLLVEYARSFFPIFFIVLILRSFIVEPFRIPSASMMPTLLIGDFILVNKYDYGIRLPVIHTKIIENSDPKRGDVVVFRYPENPSIPYIKRVVGLPGDRISYYNKTLYINGTPMEQRIKGRFIGKGSNKIHHDVSWRTEFLGDLRHDILIDPDGFPGNTEVVVPENQYFVLGDNRDNSKDSRFWGFVPEQNLVGRAFMVWMNWDWKSGGITWERIGTII